MSHIIVKNLYLDYPVLGITNRNLKTQFLKAATGGIISSSKKNQVMVNALNDVNFELENGDRVGIIGHNGAGKSTLLKILAGIYVPTKGQIITKGKIVSTLNLSIGMLPDATGYENIIIRGMLLGMTKREVVARLDEIAQFTELGDYLKMPVKVYSSGMVTRLAFATVTSMDADILLMDEVIGTGDARFLDAAQKRLNGFMERSKILVLASHSEHTIRQFCNKAVLLDHGKLISFSEVDEAIITYQNLSAN